MKKKIFFHSFLLYLLFLSGTLSAQITHWLQKAGSPGYDEGYDISIDANGNTYTTGYFSGTSTFGSTMLTAYGVTDIFITKTDSLGIFQWAVKAGSTGSDRGLSIKADAAGNSYITGFYYGTATFGGTTITSAGVQDLFIAKYNTAGVLQWVKTAGGTEPDIGNGINVDNAGNVLVTGEFKGTASFGSFSLTSINSSIDVFTTKLDAAGNFLWAEQGAAPYIDRGIDIAADAAGNIYVTGEFTDTITFDVTHLNTIYNAIFIVKYNSAGDEQWFKKIGGGTLNLVSGIAVDASANVYVTGDFTGNLIFFGPPNVTITNTYSNRIFTAKCDSNGNLLWADADGSDGEITSRNIALDAAGNPFIIGNFKCRLNDYADQYGQGTFNSIGFWDIFVTKYSTAGIRQWSRQYGSKADDYGGGIALDLNNDASIAGSFQRSFMFPYSGTLIGYSTYYISGGSGYCGDPLYGEYEGSSSSGNAEILVADIVDLNNEPYDYYQRYGAGCTKPYIGVCIDDYNYYYSGCHDSIEFCGEGELHANSQTTPAGPDFNYLWSNGEAYDYINVNTSGYYSVTQTSADGCFVSSAGIYVTIHPIPPRPDISDDHGININSTFPQTIQLCNDSALLTGGSFGSLTHWWTGPTGSYIGNTDMATVSGVYAFMDSTIYGCVSGTSVRVIIDTALSPIIPAMFCMEDSIHGNDSITLCFGQEFSMYIYDSISNPNGDPGCIPNNTNATIYWSVSPDTAIYYLPVPNYSCDMGTYNQNIFQPHESGTYILNAMIVRATSCDADTVYVSDTIHVDLLPNPVLSISGDPYICPGDSSLLVASGAATYNWLWLGSTNDSVWVNQDDIYIVTGTNSAGCTGVATFEVTVYPASQPVITMNPSNGLICPGDSVQLFCSGAGTFQWEGPSGPVAGNTPSIFVNVPGIYYCIRTDTNGCLYTNVSNTVQVNQYGTPYVLSTPSTVLCPGGSLLISVVSNDTSNIQWQSPLNGNSTTQTVTSPGTYTCSITSCGITTMSSVVITMSNVDATITAGGPLTFCNGDSVVLSANSGMANYDWEPGSSSQPSVAIYDAGTYTLSTIDAYGCEATSAPFTVTVLPAPLLSVNSASICKGGSATLTASGSTSYLWSTGDTIPGIIVSPSISTSYTVSSTTGSCTSSVISTVTVNPVPVITVNSPFVCSGQAATLTASGAGAYSWSTGDLANSIVVTPAVGTTYTVTGTSAGCSSSATATVSVLPSPSVSVNAATICTGQVATLSATGASTYSWSTGGITNSISISPLTTTSYSVSGTTSGCADTAFALVTVNPVPVLVVNSASICNGQTATLTVSGATSFSWSTGASVNSIMVSPSTTTIYSVSGSTSGCTASSTSTVTVIPVPSVTVNSEVVCEGETATLTASGADTYVWSTGDITNTISVTPSANTTYTITGTTNSCPDTATGNVTVTPNMASPPVVSNVEICAGDVATLTAAGSGTIQWYSSPLPGTPISSGYEFVTPELTSITTYYVLSQDADCKSPLVPVTVNVEDCDNIIVPNIFTPNGDDVNDQLFFHSNASRCFHCRIYNRWGTLVYELNDAAGGWNGTVLKTGKSAPDGVYYYILDYCTFSDEKELAGFVQLIRE